MTFQTIGPFLCFQHSSSHWILQDNSDSSAFHFRYPHLPMKPSRYSDLNHSPLNHSPLNHFSLNYSSLNHFSSNHYPLNHFVLNSFGLNHFALVRSWLKHAHRCKLFQHLWVCCGRESPEGRQGFQKSTYSGG